MRTQRLAGKIALVTGASRGIGAAIAKRYAEEGAELILVARNSDGLEAVDDAVRKAGSKSTLVPLDLREHHKIPELAQTIAKKFGKLDILVGNAGILGALTPLTHLTPSLWDEVLSVNLTANWYLIRYCDPLLRAAKAGRALFVTSGVTRRDSTPYWGAYTASKVALESLVRTYAAESEKGTIRANIIDPRIVRTNMRADAFPGEDPLSLPPPEDITEQFVTLAEESCTSQGERFFV